MRNYLTLFLITLSGTLAAQDTEEVLTYLEPYRSIEISPIEIGVISEVVANEGDKVSVGDVLLKLDTEITEARLGIAQMQADSEGRVQAAEAEFELQQDRTDRVERLSGASAAEKRKERATLKIAEGNLIIAQEERESYKLQVKQIEAELRRRILTSPIDGIVTEITKDVAEAVTPSEIREDNFLVRVVKVDQLRCVGHVPESLARSLHVGDSLDVRIEDGKDTMVRGKIEFVSAVINPATKTIRIRLVIENQSGKLRSGSSANILIPRRLS
tara:strand:- start:64622 stop:65437 length:816 start_codon:yes stop_codon:yes gene_type:complete